MSSSSSPLTCASPRLLPLLLLPPLVLLLSRQLFARPVPTESDHPRHHQPSSPQPWRGFEKFLDAQRGMHVPGMSQLKRYFHRFGYLPAANGTTDCFTDEFDEPFQSAVSIYQSNLGLNVNGRLDSATVSQITSPRCGVSDVVDVTTTVPVRARLTSTLHSIKHFAFFPGRPSWSRPRPMTLTYAFSPDYSISYIGQPSIQTAFRRSFARWAAAIPVSFTETTDYSMADIRIGFYAGEHGDRVPFDGVLGILAHAFSPESGRLHLDAAERWAVDFDKEKASNAIDLESVATHEIGHILGLGHTSVKEAVMYPSLSPRSRKVDLSADDVEGVQVLYGINTNFSFSSLAHPKVSDTSSSSMTVASDRWRSTVAGATVMVVLAVHSMI